MPGPGTLRYGGHTTCVEVRAAEGHIIIIDAGSGLAELGRTLLKQKRPRRLTLLFTHAHWDHLSGFPFFGPAYSSRFQITLCGGPEAQQSLRGYLAHTMQPPYFPVEFSHLKARFQSGCRCGYTDCHNRLPGGPCGLSCHALPLNHPNGGYGFQFVENGKRFVFLTDNELGFEHSDAPSRDELVDFCAGADLLLHDAQYNAREYRHTRGWGHSTFTDAVDLALEAGVRRLGLFHHDPDRSDAELDRIVHACRARIARAGSKMRCFAAAEKQVVTL